jgi:hypothetical protein
MRILIVAAFLLTTAPAWAEEVERVPPVANEAARRECGACHMAYQPQLLPAKSWRRLLGDLSNHFGTDASLDEAARQEILAYYVAQASRLTGAQAPLRIT